MCSELEKRKSAENFYLEKLKREDVDALRELLVHIRHHVALADDFKLSYKAFIVDAYFGVFEHKVVRTDITSFKDFLSKRKRMMQPEAAFYENEIANLYIAFSNDNYLARYRMKDGKNR